MGLLWLTTLTLQIICLLSGYDKSSGYPTTLNGLHDGKWLKWVKENCKDSLFTDLCLQAVNFDL